MGSGSFDAGAYRAYGATTKGKTTDEVYAARGMNKDLDPKGVKVRESRDSDEHQNSTPLIVAIDVTGSMGMIADVIAREGLGTLFTEILKSKPISDPQLMFMAIGDASCDLAPLQVSQFESDNRIVEQLTKIYLEHGGGGNCTESYNLPWYFAANHTVHDSLIKRGKRGYLFTIGDEESPAPLLAKHIEEFIGDTVQRPPTNAELLVEVRRMYDVFHIVIEQGDHCRHSLDKVVSSWSTMIGQGMIRLKDYTKVCETIISIIEVREGRDVATATSKWGKPVYDAVKGIKAASRPTLALT